ncbi:hypothetical protein FKG94_09905 [Exilibacterium tricleocarpae]|uniref:Uncharacterized protein n=1 Tax=Exilibacterium tricleocarpae TaxID=2591008 RepID=A0A545TUV5_9GAMM|nr:hypothetical protein [Exilibacterium tricleocarpae]TQV81000.1 hypothetical protein FKG94_09905 [Exilibacterium tricleocarpae]
MANYQLIWNLHGIHYKDKAVNFLQRFEDSLCVFSGAVSQVYANYNIWPITADNSKLLVLPNPNAHHDIFQSIDSDAVVSTGLYILPGEVVGKKGLFLSHKSRLNGKLKVTPLAQGLEKVAAKTDTPFLPVITNKDLKELNRKSPILHLHRLLPERLESHSQFDVRTICGTIEEKMHKYLACA